MNRNFALFAGDYYYPRGGWDDLVQILDTQEGAEKLAESLCRGINKVYDWYQIVDLENMRQVI